MQVIIRNRSVTLVVDTLGAQMLSLKSCDGTQYLWQRNPKYWSGCSPNLFPFIGRLTQNRCSCYGKEYAMGIHGFAAGMEFSPVESTATSVVLELNANEETKRQYPFEFTLRITYTLTDSTVSVRCEVRNLDSKTMPFAIGGHPGFNVPLISGETFEDYMLEFTQPCQPERIGFTPQVYLSGRDTPYPLKDGKCIPLRHDIFDEDAIILKNVSREVTLRSLVSGRGVRVSAPDMPYFGFWHMPKTDAPYVCIEPWSSLPSRQDIVEELTCKSDMIQLPAGGIYTTEWSISVF